MKICIDFWFIEGKNVNITWEFEPTGTYVPKIQAHSKEWSRKRLL